MSYETVYEMVMRVMDDYLPYHPNFCGPCWYCGGSREKR